MTAVWLLFVLGASTSEVTTSTAAAVRPSFRPSTFRLHHPNYLVLGAPPGNLKVQLSIRYGLLAIGERFSLQFGYTQRSFWAIYERSAPFLETNYLPEAIFEYRLSPCLEPARVAISVHSPDREQLRHDEAKSCLTEDRGLRVRYLRAGVEHESNGRADQSRAWNRLYLGLSIELSDRRGATTGAELEISEDPPGAFLRLSPRVWLPFGLTPANDDIADFRGYGDLHLEAGTPRLSIGRLILDVIAEKGVGGWPTGHIESALFWQPWEDGDRPWLELDWWLGDGERMLRFDRGDDFLRVGLGFRG